VLSEGGGTTFDNLAPRDQALGGRENTGVSNTYTDTGLFNIQTPELGRDRLQNSLEGSFVPHFMKAQMQIMAQQEANKMAEREDELRKEDEERKSRWENAQEGGVARSREEEWLHWQNMAMLSSLPCLSTTDE